MSARFSPDGRWVAYASGESGRVEVYVTDFPAAKRKLQVSTSGGFGPEWAPNGRELYYAIENRIMAVTVKAAGSLLTFGRPVQLFDGIEVTGLATPYSVAPDGRFLVVQPAQTDPGRRSHFTLVLNWHEELKRLVPMR